MGSISSIPSSSVPTLFLAPRLERETDSDAGMAGDADSAPSCGDGLVTHEEQCEDAETRSCTTACDTTETQTCSSCARTTCVSPDKRRIGCDVFH